jgi:hypothetical protein
VVAGNLRMMARHVGDSVGESAISCGFVVGFGGVRSGSKRRGELVGW